MELLVIKVGKNMSNNRELLDQELLLSTYKTGVLRSFGSLLFVKRGFGMICLVPSKSAISS